MKEGEFGVVGQILSGRPSARGGSSAGFIHKYLMINRIANYVHWIPIPESLLLVFYIFVQTAFFQKPPPIDMDEVMAIMNVWDQEKAGGKLYTYPDFGIEDRSIAGYGEHFHIQLLRIWSRFFDIGLISFRLFSSFFGLLLVLVTYRLGCVIFSCFSAFVGTFALIFTLPIAANFNEARQDSLYSFLAYLSLLLIWIAIKREKYYLHLIAGLIMSISLFCHIRALHPILGGLSMYAYHYRKNIFNTRFISWVIPVAIAAIIYGIRWHEPIIYYQSMKKTYFQLPDFIDGLSNFINSSSWAVSTEYWGPLSIKPYFGVNFWPLNFMLVVMASAWTWLYSKRSEDLKMYFIVLGILILAVFTISPSRYSLVFYMPWACLVIGEGARSSFQALKSYYHQNKYFATGILLLSVVCVGFASTVRDTYVFHSIFLFLFYGLFCFWFTGFSTGDVSDKIMFSLFMSLPSILIIRTFSGDILGIWMGRQPDIWVGSIGLLTLILIAHTFLFSKKRISRILHQQTLIIMSMIYALWAGSLPMNTRILYELKRETAAEYFSCLAHLQRQLSENKKVLGEDMVWWAFRFNHFMGIPGFYEPYFFFLSDTVAINRIAKSFKPDLFIISIDRSNRWYGKGGLSENWFKKNWGARSQLVNIECSHYENFNVYSLDWHTENE